MMEAGTLSRISDNVMPNYISHGNPYLEAANFGSAAGNSMADAMLKLPLQRMALARQAQQDQMEQQRQANTEKYRQATLEQRQSDSTERKINDTYKRPNQYAGEIKALQDEIAGVRASNKQQEIGIEKDRGLLQKRDELAEKARHNKAQEQAVANRVPSAPKYPLGVEPSVATALLKEGSPLDPTSRTNLAQMIFKQASSHASPGAPPSIGLAGGSPQQPAPPAGITAPPPVGLQAAPTPQLPAGMTPNDAVSQARAAIQAGANPAEVNARLQKLGLAPIQ